MDGDDLNKRVRYLQYEKEELTKEEIEIIEDIYFTIENFEKRGKDNG